jgi:Ca2+-binding EF-hand superfamily protein
MYCVGDALTQEEVTESLKLANIDKDGKIDYKEFAKVTKLADMCIYIPVDS